jgi:hypothetical protein
VVTFANHALWFWHFYDNMNAMPHVVVFFSIVIWLTPLSLLLSMSDNQLCLPNFSTLIFADRPPLTYVAPNESRIKGKNRNLIGSLIAPFFAKPALDNPKHLN